MKTEFLKLRVILLLLIAWSYPAHGQQTGVFQLQIDTKTERIKPGNCEEAIRKKLKLNPQEELRLISSETDRKGNLHQKFQHYYKGIKVEYGIIIAHFRDGVMSAINGELYPVQNIGISKLSEKDALGLAISNIGAKKYLWQSPEMEAQIKKEKQNEKATNYPTGELVILDGELAWKFKVYASDPESHDIVYVHAETGKILEKQSLICHDSVTANTRYSGFQTINTHYDPSTMQYKLFDYSRGQGIEVYNLNNTHVSNPTITEFLDNDNNWSWTSNDDAAIDAFWGAEIAYDYWSDVHGRNSFDGNGEKIIVWAHYYTQPAASWDGTRIKLGDGDNLIGPKTSLDIVAHELGHGLKDHTAKFSSYYEPGALNEGFSDIWAACAENYANNVLGLTKNIWLFEEDIYPSGDALRSLSNPKQFNNPDTYKGQYWFSGPYTYDNGGVHLNCTVIGHWFHILSVGKQGTNDHGFAYDVAGIGIQKAEVIAYQAERFYLTSRSGYYGARYATIAAAEDLFGPADVQAVKDSWDAVGVTDIFQNTPDYCSPTVQNPIGNWIKSVKVSTLSQEIKLHQHDNGNSYSSNGYTNYIYAGLIASVNAGQEYVVDVTGAGASDNYYKIWIDYNRDGNFTDQDELVVNVGPTYNHTGTILIDPSTPPGFTRMRVAIKSGSPPDSPCNIAGDGEIEDYGLQIHPPCAPVSNLSVTQLSQTSAAIAITGATTNYQLNYGDTNGDPGEWQTIVVNNNPKIDLSPNTAYLFKARSVCGVDAYSDWTPLKILDVVNYCLPNLPGGQPTYSGAWINPPNGRAINFYGYQDFTKSTVINVSPGSQYNFTIVPAGDGDNNPYYYHIWIDLNNDGDFSMNELKYQSPPVVGSTQLPIVGSFTVPSVVGRHRMRILMLDHPASSACENYLNGETEDYLIDIDPYCSSYGTNTSFEWIDLVGFDSRSYPSGNDGGYEDYTSLTPTGLLKAANVNIHLSLGNGAIVSRTRYFRVWIDFNHNGSFNDAGESVVSTFTTSSQTIYRSFTIPASALTGITKMRVSLKYNGDPGACGAFTYGEVEDYLVNIIPFWMPSSNSFESQLKTSDQGSQENTSVYPNPVRDVLNVSGGNDADLMTIIDINGLELYKGKYQQTFDAKFLPQNKMYVIMIQGPRGIRTVKFIKE